MMTFRNLVCLTLIAVVSSSAIADEKEKKDKRKKGQRKTPSATQQLLSKIELNEEQKAQVADVDKQFAEKFTAIRKAMSEILTDEQKETQRNMTKAAKEAGKKPAEGRKEVEAALKLTDEQKAKRKETQANMKKLQVEVLTALKKVLTAEQQEKLPKRGGKGARGAKGEKSKKKKKDAA